MKLKSLCLQIKISMSTLSKDCLCWRHWTFWPTWSRPRAPWAPGPPPADGAEILLMYFCHENFASYIEYTFPPVFPDIYIDICEHIFNLGNITFPSYWINVPPLMSALVLSVTCNIELFICIFGCIFIHLYLCQASLNWKL